MSIHDNTTLLEKALEQANNLPTTDGGIVLPTLSDPAASKQVLSPYEFIDESGDKQVGTMTDNGALSQELAAGESVTIPEGYHDGNGKVTAKDLESQTPGTATEAKLLDGEIAWVNGNKVIGDIPSKAASDVNADGATVTVPVGYYEEQVEKSVKTTEQGTPSIDVDNNGKITASVEQSAGFVAEGTTSTTKQLVVQVAKEVTPGTEDQTVVASGVFTTGNIVVKGDPNLLPENIPENVTLFGVTGTKKSGGVDTCTIEVTGLSEYQYAVTKFEDGVISCVTGNSLASPFILNNVICGSLIYLFSSAIDVSVGGGVEMMDDFNGAFPPRFFAVRTEAGATGTITFEED